MIRQPLGNRIFIEPDKEKELKKGSIILTAPITTFKSGIVTAVGTSVTEVKKGAHVYYHKQSGVKINPDEAVIVMTENEIWWVESKK